MTWPTRIVRSAVVATLVLAAASCSTTVPRADDHVTPSTAGAGVGTGATTTSAAPTTTVPIDTAALERLLPTAAEIGPGYSVEPDDANDGQSALDQRLDAAMAKACPDLARLSSQMSQVLTVAYRRPSADAGRSFADASSRQVGVDLSVGDDVIATKHQVDQLVGAFNKCTTIDVPDAVVGADLAMTMDASPDDHYGDLGMVVTMDMTLSGGQVGGSVELTEHLRIFQRGAVAVTISTADGVDPVSGRVVAVDYDLAANLAKRIDADLVKLQRH